GGDGDDVVDDVLGDDVGRVLARDVVAELGGDLAHGGAAGGDDFAVMIDAERVGDGDGPVIAVVDGVVSGAGGNELHLLSEVQVDRADGAGVDVLIIGSRVAERRREGRAIQLRDVKRGVVSNDRVAGNW